MLGGKKVNKTALAKQYGCCWRTIDKRLNSEKYKKERKLRLYTSMLDPYKNIIIKENMELLIDMFQVKSKVS